MRKVGNYRNHSRRARWVAWIIDTFLFFLLWIKRFFRKLFFPFRSVSRRNEPFSVAGKILLIRLDHLGDLLMTTPAISAIKSSFPQSTLHLLGGPSALALAPGLPQIKKTFTFSVPWYDGGRAQLFSVRQYVCLIRKLRQEKYDAVIDFRGDIRILVLFALLSGAPVRVGYSRLGGESLLTHSVPFDTSAHFVVGNLSLIQTLTWSARIEADPQPSIIPTREDRAYIQRLLESMGERQNSRWVVIHPTTIPHWQLKRWPPERFATLADELIHHEGIRIIFTGTEMDAPALDLIIANMKAPALNLARKTSLLGLAALLAGCALFVSGDTGPMHLAAAVGAPLVAIFGPTESARSGPYGQAHRIRVLQHPIPCRRPCYVSRCPAEHRCMREISVTEVLWACRELLAVQKKGEK